MAELKSCPFCGGKAGLLTSLTQLGQNPILLAMVRCKKCQASTKTFDNSIDAANAWNKRTYNVGKRRAEDGK